MEEGARPGASAPGLWCTPSGITEHASPAATMTEVAKLFLVHAFYGPVAGFGA